MDYFVVLTDWKNSGMLGHIVGDESFIFSYPDKLLPFNFAPYMHSGHEDVDEEYREVSE
ncbi:hypothetical protein [Weissella paramesenteroides]|uniref:hypothetical protein n=1 Tax=Weissella paramesenteroides TaxID=1249 RepID=UPI00388E972C